MTTLLDESVRQIVKQRFSDMKNPVTLRVFSTKGHCLFCNEMISLMTEVASLSDKIELDICDCEASHPKAKEYGIERHPAIVIEGDKDYGVRFFGVPAGKEFTTLVESIMLVANRDAILSPQAHEMLKSIKQKVNLKVFVTLECPYCPAMVLRAHKLAIANDFITAEMIEASQFAQLASVFDIFGVPNTIINDGKGNVEGLVPEEMLLQAILESFKH